MLFSRWKHNTQQDADRAREAEAATDWKRGRLLICRLGHNAQWSQPARPSATRSFSSFTKSLLHTDHALCGVGERRGGGFSSREGEL